MKATDPVGKIPVTLITGFLGSGKTTLLRAMLARDELAGSAVLINEFGEIAIDDSLVRSRAGEVITLESGCLCCSLRDGLAFTLRDLEARVVDGTIPAFHRVLIETTGLADPAPILNALAIDPALTAGYRLAATVVTVDAVNGWSGLDRQPEAVRQVAVADHLLLTKTDLAAEADIARLEDRLRALNSDAEMARVIAGAIDPTPFLVAPTRSNSGPGDYAADEIRHHDPEIATFAVVLETAPTRANFERWLKTLLAHRGDDLLRLKGVVKFADYEHPVLINSVGGLLHPFEALDPDHVETGAGHLVFITRRISRDVIEDSLRII